MPPVMIHKVLSFVHIYDFAFNIKNTNTDRKALEFWNPFYFIIMLDGQRRLLKKLNEGTEKLYFLFQSLG